MQMTDRIPRRVSTALLNSLSAGVVPRIGLEYIAVGRAAEIKAMLLDLEDIAAGGAGWRLICGRYGSGKSFLLQLLRNHAMDRRFVVADADLSPERRLSGSQRQGVATYRELMKNMATRTRPDGGALPAILERWISSISSQVRQETGLAPQEEAFLQAVEQRIMAVVSNMEGLVHGFDFATVLASYWRGHRQEQDQLKDAALRWLRGEFATKTDARAALGVRVIVDDDSWYDYIKLMARFVTDIGYKGLIILLDELVNLYKISHSLSRQANYEKLLTMFNDTMQGKAEHLGIILAGTPQFVDDTRRGLFSYEALRSRLAASRFMREGLQDTASPILRLQPLSHEELYVLLTRLQTVYRSHHGQEVALGEAQLTEFLQIAFDRLGARELLTPREIIRDFITLLNLLRQNPDLTFAELVQSSEWQHQRQQDDDQLAEFML
jgi:hypothetical protein